LAWIGFIL